MVLTVLPLEGGRVYISSTGFTGILESFPGGIVAVHRAKKSNFDKINVLGCGPSNYYKLLKHKDYYKLKDSKDEDKSCYKIWNLSEQVSCFLDDETYQGWNLENRECKVMSFDIEIGTKRGRKPSAENDPILMIGYSMGNGQVHIVDENDEENTVRKFLKVMEEEDPDVITGYFVKGFDIPFLLRRMSKLGIEFPEELHRVKEVPYRLLRRKNEYVDPYNNDVTSIAYSALGFGRVVYDIYESSVKLDTSIVTKNRRLKTVAKFFGSKDVYDIEDEEKSSMLELYQRDRQRLYTYLESDVRQNNFLFSIYWSRIKELSNLSRAPMDYLLNSYGRAPFARMFLLRSFILQKTYPIVSNYIRYRKIFDNAKGKYQGALTAIVNKGRFKNVSKVDFSSMYPNIMITFNISPDSIRFLGMDHRKLEWPNIGSQYSIEKIKSKLGKASKWASNISLGIEREKGEDVYPIIVEENNKNYIIVSIPDMGIGAYLTIKIFKRKKGIIPTQLEKLFKIREETRKKMKEYEKGSTEWNALNSKQLGTKVGSNSVYGLLGTKSLEIGDICCASLVTAFGREISYYIASIIGDKKVLEIDTDGVYTSGDIDTEDLNSKLTMAIKEKYTDMPFEPTMKLELEEEGIKGLFLGQKNYALQNPKDESGEVSIKGSSMKGSNKSEFVEQTFMLTAKMLLGWEDPTVVLNKIKDRIYNTKFPSEAFKMSRSIMKDEYSYKRDGGLLYHLKRVKKLYKDNQMNLKEAISYISRMLDVEVENIVEEYSKKGKDLPTTAEDIDKIIGNWGNSMAKVKSIEELISKTEWAIYSITGGIKKRGMDVNYRILMKANEAGIQILTGDSIEYYMSISKDGFELYNQENLEKYPINIKWYTEAIETVFNKMIQVVIQQEKGELFSLS